MGKYEVQRKDTHGKTVYCNAATGATLHFVSGGVNRWTLLHRESRTQYSSSVNADKDVPWRKHGGYMYMEQGSGLRTIRTDT